MNTILVLLYYGIFLALSIAINSPLFVIPASFGFPILNLKILVIPLAVKSLIRNQGLFYIQKQIQLML